MADQMRSIKYITGAFQRFAMSLTSAPAVPAADHAVVKGVEVIDHEQAQEAQKQTSP